MVSWNEIYFSKINIYNIKRLRWSHILEKMIMYQATDTWESSTKKWDRGGKGSHLQGRQVVLFFNSWI